MASTVAAAAPPMAVRTRRLLEGPVAPTLLGLAAPNVLVMVLQAVVTTLDAVFVGWLGSAALAGVSLVYPLVMLMQTMSAGGMGGGVSSAVARALGAGRRAEAQALAVHAILIALVMASLFTTGLLLGGPAVYRAIGGTGDALAAALTYSRVMFGGAVVFWLLNTLGSIVRGTGTMALPAAVMSGSAVLYLALAPALVMGWGPFPRLGVAGTATANLSAFGLATLVLAVYLCSPWSTVRLSVRGFRFRRELFWEILRVGAPGSLNTILTNLTVVLMTGLVGPFGTAALAGYGMGARLEYIQIPLVFGMGSALVAMVGTNVGAGQIARAERIAWTGAGLAAGVTASIGVLAAAFPGAWLGLFTADPQVHAAGATYLLIVGPTYGFFGLGLALYFASQGAGRLAWPLTAGFARLGIAAAGGWLGGYGLGWGLPGIFAAMAIALIVFGTTTAAAVRLGAWR
jgi:putative MATE family efflux protein